MFRAPDPAWYYRASAPADPRLTVTYLGTAGFVLTGAGRTVVVDPYVTRPGIFATLVRPLVPNAGQIRNLIPRADDVLVGHSHYDHVLDGPELCRQTGARLIGSPDVANVGRAAGLPEAQIVATRGGEDVACGPCVVRGLPSLHGRVYGWVPFPGTIDAPPPWPPRFYQLPHGLVLNWWLDIGGMRVVHIDSADFIDEELADRVCDVLCLCAIGRQYRARFTEDAIRLLRPKYVIPCHWDLFSTPIEATPRLLPGVDLPAFAEEIRVAGADPVLLPFLGTFAI